LLRPGLTVNVLRRLAMLLYRRAARVVVVTEAFADRIASYGIPRSKLTVIPNGADLALFAADRDRPAARQRLGLTDEFVVAYVGAHGVSHGLGAVLDAAALQPDVTFLLVGDGAEKDGLAVERERRKLSNVTMLPSVPKSEVPDIYAAADTCLVPLRDVPLFDAFVPSKLFEVLAAGKPVIGAVRGEARVILERSGGAVLVSPENGAEIADAVARLRADPSLRATLGQRGQAFVREHYDRDALAARYLDVLGSLTNA
jgi:glycosyltransferase involved in cell wall biosynthesis